MTRRDLLKLPCAGAAFSLCAAEPDVWNEKAPEEWHAGDVYRIMNKSPWAMQVQAQPNPRARGPFFGRSRYAAGRLPAFPAYGPKVVVVWESARPVRDALKAPLPGAFAGLYAISLEGFSMMADFRRDSLNYLRPYLSLTPKGRTAVTASVVRRHPRNPLVILAGFSKNAASIRPDDKEAVFRADLGMLAVQAKFKPKEMLYHGELAV